VATRPPEQERVQAIAAAKVAAHYDVACGGTDRHATLEALHARILDARSTEASSERAIADGIERALAAAGIDLEG
jgi:hypothetical protein